jgi:hypothetical protein
VRRLLIDTIYTHDTDVNDCSSRSFIADNELDGDAPLRLCDWSRQLLDTAATR